jgi:hypothetical protein
MIAGHLLAVECPTCHAEIGESCHTYTGQRSPTVHVARQNLIHQPALNAEPSLDDDDDRRTLSRYAAEGIAEAEA